MAKDADRDMALLQIDPKEFGELRPLSLASGGVKRGSRVAVFGYPLGDEIGTGLKFNPGHVMGLPETSNKDMLLIDGRVNPGNSGGPLLNSFSQVVGMVTAKSHAGDGLDSYGMAIPASELRKFIAQHLPNYSPPPEQTRDPKNALEWDEVDANVKDSVLMVLKLKAN